VSAIAFVYVFVTLILVRSMILPPALKTEHASARRWADRETLGRSSEADRKILLRTGIGHDSVTLADQLSIRPAAMRKRLDRLRTKFAA